MKKVGKDKKDSLVSFGKGGWFTIIYCMLMFWFFIGMINDGSNYTAPAVAANLGVESGVIVSMNGVAGLIGIIVFILVGQFNRKVGPRVSSGVLYILGGVFYFLIANASSVMMYTLCMALLVGCVMSAAYISGGVLVARWFPKRKGIVMGYTTMGCNLASAFYVPIIAFLVGNMGVKMGVIPICIAEMILGLVGLLFVRNNPQERGQNPDNVSDEVYALEYDTDDAVDSDGGWTTGRLLRDKHMWLAAVTPGLLQVCSTGVMTQLVVRNIELGFSEGKAVATMTVLALIGVAGSWFIGVLDQKLGTKKAMMGFSAFYGLALVLNATNNMPLVYISLLMIAISIGGSANFTASLPTAVFGRHGYDKVNSVVFPIQGAVTNLAFLINGRILLMTGQLRYAYVVLAVIAFVNVVLIALVNEHKYNRDFNSQVEI